MNQAIGPRVLMADVLEDVATAVGTEVNVLGRLAGGVNAGAFRVRLGESQDAVLKAELLLRGGRLDEVRRAERIVEHMRARGYPTPAWLAVGATSAQVWTLTEFVDAVPAERLTPAVVEQLMEIVELEAGQATEPYDHGAYAWRVASGAEPVGVRLSSHSSAVSALVERARLACDGARPPTAAPDMVHADLNPSNVLVRDGAVVALVDIGNAGSGTRATDLVTLQWHTFDASLDEVRQRLWVRILGLVGEEGAAVLTATQILLQLEWTVRLGRPDLVAEVVERGHRTLDELDARR